MNKIIFPEAEELYKAGATSTQLATRYNVGFQNVLKALKKRGVEIRPPNRGSTKTYSPDVIQDVILYYKSGFTHKDVGEKTDLSRSTVQRILTEQKINQRKNGTRSPTIKMPTDQFSVGYFCGLLDGEGNLQTRIKKNSNTIGCKIAIYSTTVGIMNWLSTNIGGSVHWSTARTKKGWLPIGIWEIYRAQDVLNILETVYPYLIVKKKKAKEIINHLKHNLNR